MRHLLFLISLLHLLHWLCAFWSQVLKFLSHKQPLCFLFALHLPGSYSWSLFRYFYSEIDRILLWSKGGLNHGEVAGGYSFPISWRYSLPRVQPSALGAYNFETGPNYMLSFQAELTSMTTTGGAVLLEPKGAKAGIIFLAFSVIVVTQDTNYLELIVLSRTKLNPGNSQLMYVNSSKFSFGNTSSPPINSYFFQWVTGQDYPLSRAYYSARIALTTSSNSSNGELKV